MLDRPRVLLAPREPYFPDPQEPYRPGGGALIELPILVSPWSRLPFIGTWAAAFPRPLVRASYLAARGAPFFNFELHAIDVLGESDGIALPLVRRQRDLAVSPQLKMSRLREVFGWLREDYEVVTLAEAAERCRAAARGTAGQ